MGVEEVKKKAMGLEVEREREEEEVSWEKVMLRAPVRVLLVEGDDSTRQIITALLRKCGYRVSVASDGLTAWEMLRVKDHNIDLVLTEVELPKMSGFVLLTMMMDLDSCNHIPIIMMSSNDSVSISFKCLIKGAADLLVKPIRKNELKNLWQHVWRKQKGEIGVTQNTTVDLCCDRRSMKNASDKKDDMVCYQKESDAQSSCTRSDVEVESTCKLGDNVVLNQTGHKKFSLFDETTSDETTSPDNHFEYQLDGMSLFPNDEANGVISLGLHIQQDGKTNCQELDRNESSIELFDLIEVINNQTQPTSISENSCDNLAENLLMNIEVEMKPSSAPSLELSLDGKSHNNPNRQEIDGPITLHHSNSSAFSLYNNNSTVVPKMSKITNSQAQNNGGSNNSTETDGNKFIDTKLPCREGTTFRCTPIRLIPVPARDTSFDRTQSNPFFQSIFYPQSASFYGAMPSILHDSLADFKSAHCHNLEKEAEQLDEQSHDLEEAEQLDEQRYASTVTGDSNDSRYNLNENVSTGVSNEDSRFSRSGDDNGFQTFGEIKQADDSHLSQREVALNKFRLKRKERCFEKKVRYLSRQRLAEQRPRVKGQFVRQV